MLDVRATLAPQPVGTAAPTSNAVGAHPQPSRFCACTVKLTLAPPGVHTVPPGCSVTAGAMRVQLAGGNVTWTRAPPVPTDTGVIFTPDCGSVNDRLTVSAASLHVLVDGVMSSR